jgi:hypothetical protein
MKMVFVVPQRVVGVETDSDLIGHWGPLSPTCHMTMRW